MAYVPRMFYRYGAARAATTQITAQTLLAAGWKPGEAIADANPALVDAGSGSGSGGVSQAVLDATVALLQDKATAATDAELASAVAPINTALATKQDAATAATDAEVASQLISFLRARSRRVWAVGDSITAGAPTVNLVDAVYTSGFLQGGIQYSPSSWQTHAILASNARWTLAGYGATAGYTAAQILSTHVPAVIAAASPGDTVVVIAGTNGNVFSDAQAIHDTLRAAGLLTVAVTLPPSGAGSVSSIAAFNYKLKNYAMSKGIPVYDAHAALVDPATGTYLAAYNSGDGVHPSILGFQVLGQGIAGVLDTVMPAGRGEIVDHNAGFVGGLQPHPLGTGAAQYTEWTSFAALGTSTITVPSAKASFKGGTSYRFVRGDSDINAILAAKTLIPGHRYRYGGAINFSIAAGGSLSYRLESNTTGEKVLWGLGYPTALSGFNQGDGWFYCDFVCPTLPDYTYRPRIFITGAGTTLDLGEITWLDLTALGA